MTQTAAVRKGRAHLVRAQSAEDIVVAHFEGRGFTVFDRGDACANGHDMTIAKGGHSWRVEVKAATFSKGSHVVKPVKETRRGDDLVAMVTLGDRVIVQPMKDHLACCSEDGSRRITDLVKILAAIHGEPA